MSRKRSRTHRSAAFFALGTLLWISAPGLAFAQEPRQTPPAPGNSPPPAPSTPEMQRPFEGLYTAWRDAMTNADLEAWKKVTATSRRIETRNRIVSQRLKYPESLFIGPVQAPPLTGLTHVGTLVRGDAGTSVYFGRADFGVSDPSEVTENFVVFRFLRDGGLWKFDNLRVVKFGDDPELLLKVRNGDLTFLEAPEFQPPAEIPPMPFEVSAPDYVAEVWITAVGYEATVKINNTHASTVANDSGPDLVVGGLKTNGNRIEISTKRIPVDAATPRHLEVGIYAAGSASGEAKRVYHYRSSAEAAPPEKMEAQFAVEGVPK
ncbi:MAG: hypothetical protein H7A52_13190 [Akkermansiaceae bacterium]|nr:hypothetical protein [Akkermansiaceae bacterium]